jgi:hypothetical protein
MWLFTVSNWWSEKEGWVASHFTNSSERTEAWFCRSSLNDGLRLLRARRDKYNSVSGPSSTKDRGCVMEFRLLSVVELPDDTDAVLLNNLGVHEINQTAVDSIA